MVCLAGAAAICLAVAGIGVVAASIGARESAAAARADRGISMDGQRVVEDPRLLPRATPSPSATPPAPAPSPPAPSAWTGDRLVVSSVGLDIPLKPLQAQAGQITPTGYTSAYWVTNLGVAPTNGDAGTVYVVMHSVRGGGIGPGNYITDVRRGTSALGVGAEVEVAGVRYRVTSSRTVPRDALASDAAVWSATPRRLVLITCLERPDGSPSVDNMVIDATRI